MEARNQRVGPHNYRLSDAGFYPLNDCGQKALGPRIVTDPGLVTRCPVAQHGLRTICPTLVRPYSYEVGDALFTWTWKGAAGRGGDLGGR